MGAAGTGQHDPYYCIAGVGIQRRDTRDTDHDKRDNECPLADGVAEGVGEHRVRVAAFGVVGGRGGRWLGHLSHRLSDKGQTLDRGGVVGAGPAAGE